jgi:DNA-binding GntR family transcriptional regulator
MKQETPETAPQESLAQQAYLILEEMIVTLALAPGTSFSEAGLGARTGFGRTPLREALKKLESQGLVITLPRKGLMVRDLKIEDILSILEVLRPLDRLLAIKAARWATPLQRRTLARLATDIRAAAAAEDQVAYLHHDRACDQIIYEAARNPLAADLVTHLYTHSRRFWYAFNHDRGLEPYAKLHADLLVAVADGEEEGAARASDALIAHLETSAKSAVGLA